jgi:ACT domain-containing protein
MKKLFKNQKTSIYKVQKDLGLSANTLYKYSRGQIPIKNMPSQLLIDLAYYFKIEANKLYNDMIDFFK